MERESGSYRNTRYYKIISPQKKYIRFFAILNKSTKWFFLETWQNDSKIEVDK